MSRPTIENFLLASKEEANQVLEAMNGVIKRYAFVSLADLYTLVGFDSTYIHSKWGWTDLKEVEIKQVGNAYSLNLPPLEEI